MKNKFLADFYFIFLFFLKFFFLIFRILEEKFADSEGS